jgi:hypothetical protein
MPKTKISEFSATPANNTDIDSINIAEGCAPSGINDAIRELMAQLKDFQTGAVGDSFNGPIGTSTAAAGAFTTLSASSTLGVTGVSTLTGGAVVQGLTVGRGAGAVSTNTAVGASALSANTTGSQSVAVGTNALAAQTSGIDNTAIGVDSLAQTTTGQNNSAIGVRSLWSNTTGQANTGLGRNALRLNTTGNYNTAQGVDALLSNTTASNNTAVGYQAGYSTTTGIENVYIGQGSGYSATTNGQNTFVGRNSGYSTTGGFNNFFGYGAGNAITTGTKNTILGRYDGNYGGLDIRTASNKIVLSDGDGNPAVYIDNPNANTAVFANSATGNRYAGFGMSINSTYKAQMYWDNTNLATYIQSGGTGGVYLGVNGNAWVSVSDERLKENLVAIENGLSKVCSLRSVTGNFIDDESKKSKSFLIAQDVQAVLPEAVSTSTQKDSDTEYLGVAYSDVIPLLVAAIKELKAEIDAYKASHP